MAGDFHDLPPHLHHMGASQSAQVAEEEEDEGDDAVQRDIPDSAGDHSVVKKILEQEPEMLPCHASASPLSPQLSAHAAVCCAAHRSRVRHRLLPPAVDHLLRRSLRRRPPRREREVMVGFLNQRRYFPSLAIEIIGWRRKQLDYAAPITVEEYSKAIAVAGEVDESEKQKKQEKKGKELQSYSIILKL